MAILDGAKRKYPADRLANFESVTVRSLRLSSRAV
jgi:hypothetical protein